MAQILVFGDSIAYGAWDEEGGWVQRLRKFIDGKVIKSNLEYCCVVYNLGIDGNTSENLLKRFEFETEKRLWEGETAFIFAIGMNDSCFAQNKKQFLVSSGKFKENTEKLIKLAKKYSEKIVFIGLTPVDETKTTPLPWNNDKFYQNESIRKYNEIIKSVCEEKRIHFIGVFEKLIKSDYKNLLADGLHPNSQGHQKIFEMVKDYLIENKIIENY